MKVINKENGFKMKCIPIIFWVYFGEGWDGTDAEVYR